MTTRDKQNKPDLTGDDEDVWRRVTSDVTPLSARRKDGALRADAKPTTVTNTSPRKPRPVVFSAPVPVIQTRSVPDLSHGQAPGLDRKTQSRMRRGKLDVQGRIDLHGLTQTEAHRALIAFITSAHENGKRAVLVITGKGLRESGEVGVLRRSVPGWLNAPPLKPMVHAFDFAARQHGGEGALYVLLKRRKERQR